MVEQNANLACRSRMTPMCCKPAASCWRDSAAALRAIRAFATPISAARWRPERAVDIVSLSAHRAPAPHRRPRRRSCAAPRSPAPPNMTVAAQFALENLASPARGRLSASGAARGDYGGEEADVFDMVDRAAASGARRSRLGPGRRHDAQRASVACATIPFGPRPSLPRSAATSPTMAAGSTPARPKPISAASRAAARRRRPRRRPTAATSSTAEKFSSPARRGLRWLVTLVRLPPSADGAARRSRERARQGGLAGSYHHGRVAGRAEPAKLVAIPTSTMPTCSSPKSSSSSGGRCRPPARRTAGRQRRARVSDRGR